MDCRFCTLYSNSTDIIWQDNFYWAQFDKFPVSPGHAELIPKRHVASMLDLTPDEEAAFFPAVKDLRKVIQSTNLEQVYRDFLKNPINASSQWFCEKALDSTFTINYSPTDFNMGVNDGQLAGRTIDHFHYHLIPRFKGDALFPEGGIRHIIPGMGRYK